MLCLRKLFFVLAFLSISCHASLSTLLRGGRTGLYDNIAKKLQVSFDEYPDNNEQFSDQLLRLVYGNVDKLVEAAEIASAYNDCSLAADLLQKGLNKLSKHSADFILNLGAVKSLACGIAAMPVDEATVPETIELLLHETRIKDSDIKALLAFLPPINRTTFQIYIHLIQEAVKSKRLNIFKSLIDRFGTYPSGLLGLVMQTGKGLHIKKSITGRRNPVDQMGKYILYRFTDIQPIELFNLTNDAHLFEQFPMFFKYDVRQYFEFNIPSHFSDYAEVIEFACTDEESYN